MPMNHGQFVISMDFELYWGIRDICPISHYLGHLAKEREIIPRVLDLFERSGIHATWATVGLMFFNSKDQLLHGIPARLPAYQDANLSPYPHLASGVVGTDEQTDASHYGLSLIRRIEETRYQRVSTHTFSHYYCLEAGQDSAAFQADLQAAVRIAERQGIRLESIVFPRNQVNPAYLPLLLPEGIRAYRGNPKHWLYRRGYRTGDALPRRALRLMDTYLNLSGFHCYTPEAPEQGEPLDLPASHFLRSYSGRLALLEPLRRRRILKGMTYAARNKQVYHLWCHPYNLVDEQGRNLKLLEEIIAHYKRLQSLYGMESRNMEELSDQILGSEPACELPFMGDPVEGPRELNA
ncbi:polysaccharide deacetylase [Paenibacillus sp. YPG26]|uniref:polysaccharide deacetylase family protein n=1 Tax=Paenibacillus sp. YPG26 TaxID=2878915 RepID=UPI00203DDAC7|nr:polysaccharide deacetylase [Paenibacillus sp. YPG26]USB33035.1 polysaccharide deacetylase [Paenibacillus sp. YPG26]